MAPGSGRSPFVGRGRMETVKELPPEALYTPCDPAQFTFDTTAELDGTGEILGQERAMEALQFGVGIRREGYNLFVLGPPGIGKYSVARRYLERSAETAAPPPDWCYLHNFEHPDRPRAGRRMAPRPEPGRDPGVLRRRPPGLDRGDPFRCWQGRGRRPGREAELASGPGDPGLPCHCPGYALRAWWVGEESAWRQPAGGGCGEPVQRDAGDRPNPAGLSRAHKRGCGGPGREQPPVRHGLA